MHEHHVAHRLVFLSPIYSHPFEVIPRDISILNVMMDSKPILPEMFHPQRIWRQLHDIRKDIRPYTRTARPVRYYFTDFGLSRRYAPDDANPLEDPIIGGDKTVPEFQNDPYTPRNPFHTDVYYMGNLIRVTFLQVCALSHYTSRPTCTHAQFL